MSGYVRVTTESTEVDPQVRTPLEGIAAEVASDAGEIGSTGQPIVGVVRAFLRQATELVENLARIGGWGHVDEAILQGVGRLSMAITTAFRAACESRDGLGERLGTPGSTLLDVGTGTGWVAGARPRPVDRHRSPVPVRHSPDPSGVSHATPGGRETLHGG